MANLIMAGTDGGFGNFFQSCRKAGHHVVVLDCFSDTHAALTKQFGPHVIQCAGHRHEVAMVVSEGTFDAAIVVDGGNYVRTSLMVQAMRDAGIGGIYLVTSSKQYAKIYRRIGAHSVVVTGDARDVVRCLERTPPCARKAASGIPQLLRQRRNAQISLQF